MNRPSVVARFAGSPLMAILLFVGYAVVVAEWYQGQVAWWLALGAVGAAGKTLRAVRQVRSYKAWLAEWRAMSGEDEPQRPTKRRKPGWVFVIGALLLALGIPYCLPSEAEPGIVGGSLTILWCAACLYLAFALLRGIVRLVVARRKGKAELEKVKAEAAPVALLLGVPSSSPSRAEAMATLPEYCAGLIGGIR
jgi:hypothetical protein